MSKLIATPHDALTYQVIGQCMASHRGLKRGYRENTYQRDLEIRFKAATITFEAQKWLPVFDSLDETRCIGHYVPDFIISNAIVLEIKAIADDFEDNHLRQVISYLKVTRLSIGLLVNFGKRSLEYKRILPPTDLQSHTLDIEWLRHPSPAEPPPT